MRACFISFKSLPFRLKSKASYILQPSFRKKGKLRFYLWFARFATYQLSAKLAQTLKRNILCFHPWSHYFPVVTVTCTLGLGQRRWAISMHNTRDLYHVVQNKHSTKSKHKVMKDINFTFCPMGTASQPTRHIKAKGGISHCSLAKEGQGCRVPRGFPALTHHWICLLPEKAESAPPWPWDCCQTCGRPSWGFLKSHGRPNKVFPAKSLF